MSRINSLVYLIISLLIFVLSINFSHAFSVGVSPDKISFDNLNSEAKVMIFNSNDQELSYKIESCNFNFLEMLRNGTIKSNSNRIITIRYNEELNKNISSCSIDLFFANKLYSTAFSIPLKFNKALSSSYADESSGLFDFFSDEESSSPEQTKKKSFLSIIVISLIFIILLFVIIKFVK